MASTSHSDRDILPRTIKPVHYDLSIYDIELGGAFNFQGTVKITAKVLENTKSITLNSHQLNIHDSEVLIEQSKPAETFQLSNISYDAPKQRATIEFSNEIPASEVVVVVIKFQGTINNEMAGFYRSKYKPAVTPAASVPKDGEFYYMFSTHFEACYARRAFPCFDEPNLKATFDIHIELPEDQVALSNMPVKSVHGGKPGLQVVTFHQTPIMSTYLLAWAIGDFEYIEDFTKREYKGQRLPVRVYTTKGLKEQGRFALEHAHQIIDYFSVIFKIDYPLPKADLLAVHEIVSGSPMLTVQVYDL
jgi:aminopeptidase N